MAKKEKSVAEPKPDALVAYVNESGRPTLHTAERAAELLAAVEKKLDRGQECKARIVTQDSDEYEALAAQACPLPKKGA